MKIGLVSDTHLSSRATGLPRALTEGLNGVDLILHAGDWIDERSCSLLERIAPIDGVAGNNDGPPIINRFGRRKIITVEGVHIGIVHGDGVKGTTEQRALDAFLGEKVDIILFGHSHIPHQSAHEGKILFNPGSPTDKRRQPQYSYGILTIDNGFTLSHHFYNDKSV